MGHRGPWLHTSVLWAAVASLLLPPAMTQQLSGAGPRPRNRNNNAGVSGPSGNRSGISGPPRHLLRQFMQGPGLVFAAFSQAISLLPSASLWAIVFFLALIIMGLSTLMKILDGIAFPLQNSIFRQQPLLLSVLICLGGFVGSLVFTSHPGSYIVSLFDEHVVPLTLIIIVASGLRTSQGLRTQESGGTWS